MTSTGAVAGRKPVSDTDARASRARVTFPVSVTRPLASVLPVLPPSLTVAPGAGREPGTPRIAAVALIFTFLPTSARLGDRGSVSGWRTAAGGGALVTF